MSRASSLVDVHWVSRNLGKIIPVDGSWHMPSTKRLAIQEFRQIRLPNARFFDIDQIADNSSGLPHMLPGAELFSDCMKSMQISKDDHVVVYDNCSDVYSAYRVYWTFRVFGHQKVSVLNGGLHQWLRYVDNQKRSSLLEEASLPPPSHAFLLQSNQKPQGHYAANYQSQMVCDYQAIRKALLSSDKWQVVDARSQQRFDGTAPEPRPGLRSGHMPDSINLPFTELIDPETRMLRPKDQLIDVFSRRKIDLNRPIICTCGSGVTASIVYFAGELLGAQQLALYDGSWSEYGAKPESQIVVSASL